MRLAVAFLTIVPISPRAKTRTLGAAAAWFPAVGALVGALAGTVYYVCQPAFGPGVAAILAVAVLVAITGALHEDGLADCADGLGVRGDRERRLTVMRDAAIGTFGALALLLWALLVVSALAQLDRENGLRALVVAASTGRWSALVHALAAPPARRDGLGASFTVRPSPCVIAGAAAAAVSLASVGLARGLVALGLATAIALLLTVWARAAIGGRTGDTLGATIALTEAAVMVALLGLASQ